ncbi:Alpha/Beta hydrolase protein [Schizophyllum amplum]|uniref:Carboxylic ester hydrolase n=1 Tax=Schizophyllum amplum TaxID=97359 RepID=A0A550CU31_9AGAR|nr:Alpha/Beta hydrolase protein [Auriculariopsis ampla]
MLGTTALLLALACFHSTRGSPTRRGDDLIVDLGYAQYRGNLTYPDTVSYLGVPYAQPPVGDLRFRAPVPLDTTGNTTVVDATKYPDFCVQGTTGGEAGGAGSEDCLKLNIYAPVDAQAGDNLPVLVYIHGGGYVYGNPAAWDFAHWVHQSPNVVIASVYYRLDSFGFLSAPEFAENASLGDLNAGFLDQRMALRWVQEHINKFGGDPSKVTINGESAGGASIELHLVANDEEGLFHGAIAQSVYRTPLPTPDQQKPLFDAYAQEAGCADGSVGEQMDCLRAADVSALARAQDAVMGSTELPYRLFHPVMDSVTFSDYPTKLINAGAFAQVPLIVGATSNETLASGDTIEEALMGYFPSMSEEEAAELVEKYPSDSFSSEEERTLVATGESTVRCARTIMGEAFSQTVPTWTYRYNQPNPTSGDSDVVGHAAENWMMFKGSNTGPNGTYTLTPLSDVEGAFAEELIAYWLSFVRAGDPNTYKLDRSPEWSTYSTAQRSRIALQEVEELASSGSFVEVETEEEAERCEFVGSQARSQQA